jgi:dTDP-4-amino-4,6-dideoxygalactose transaminase
MIVPFLSVSPPLPWDVYGRRPADSLPFPLQEGRVRLFARARQGLFEGLGRLGLGAGDTALVPAYHHGSEIEAYLRAGLSLRFYDARADLAPDEAELDARFGSQVRVLHLIHYLGFPQDVGRWRAWCDRKGIHLVEDAAQGWLGTACGRPLGSWGELSLFSVYKTVGVPDGGAVALRGDVLQPSGRRRRLVRAIALKHAAWLAGRWPLAGTLYARLKGATAYVAEKDFALGEPGLGATAITSALLPRLVVSPVAERRVRNYRRLLAEFGAWVPDPFRRDPEGASPFAFPVQVRDKARSASLLVERGVRAVNAWSVPHPALPVNEFPCAARRRSGLLLLPVHQELRSRDIERIVSAARVALGPPPRDRP